jgi:exonuclease VII small subunit
MAIVKPVSFKRGDATKAGIPEPVAVGERFSKPVEGEDADGRNALTVPAPSLEPTHFQELSPPSVVVLTHSHDVTNIYQQPSSIIVSGDPRLRREDYRRHIHESWNHAWTEALKKFVDIGHALSQAKRWLAHGDYEKMIAEDLPFSKQVAHQLKTLAEAVDQGRFALDELPRSYSAGYILTTLSDRELEQARENGLVSPTTSRSQLSDFRNRIRTPPIQSTSDASLSELEKLKRRRQKILEEAARLAEQIAALEGGSKIIDGTSSPIVDNEEYDTGEP